MDPACSKAEVLLLTDEGWLLAAAIQQKTLTPYAELFVNIYRCCQKPRLG